MTEDSQASAEQGSPRPEDVPAGPEGGPEDHAQQHAGREGRRYGKVVNAPTVPNDGGYEKRVAQTPSRDRTSGANSVVAGAQAFEQRAAQEQGTH